MNRLTEIHVVRTLVVLGVVLHGGILAQSQAFKVRPVPRPTPSDTKPTSLTVQVSPAQVGFSLVQSGVSQGSSGITITTTWDGLGTPPAVTLAGYFGSATAALSDGLTPPHLIPSSAVLGQMSTGLPVSYSPFSQTTAFGGAGASLLLLNTLQGELGHTGSRTDVLNLEIDLSGLPNLAPGTYSGSLTIQAQVN